jgi:hypothetical protein
MTDLGLRGSSGRVSVAMGLRESGHVIILSDFTEENPSTILTMADMKMAGMEGMEMDETPITLKKISFSVTRSKSHLDCHPALVAGSRKLKRKSVCSSLKGL